MVKPTGSLYPIPVEKHNKVVEVLHSAGFKLVGSRNFYYITQEGVKGGAEYRPINELLTTQDFPSLDKFLLELDLESL